MWRFLFFLVCGAAEVELPLEMRSRTVPPHRTHLQYKGEIFTS